METPEWVKDAVFYQIFPDRFSQSATVRKPSNLEPWDSPPTQRGFKGGDLVGVMERLDYLLDLGVSALYLTPVFQSTANHRYNTHDYLRVDPILGGDAALRSLLDAAHARGMRVVLDGVFNHAGRGFFQFNHILENGPQSPYLDWFVVERWPLYPYDRSRPPNYRAWWSDRELPAFNVGTPAVREFLWEVGSHWVEFGIDGWRLDVPEEIDDPPFWQEFRRRVKRINPDAYLVGEIWSSTAAQPWLQGDRFDGVMNYPFCRACLGFMGGGDLNTLFKPGGFELRPLGAEEFAGCMDDLAALNDWEVTQAQLNLLGSHDTPRFSTAVGGGRRAADRLKLATLFQMTYPGAPCIYYGDEIGLEGGPDPDCRRAFPWDESHWNQELREFVRRCIGLRRAHPALRRGRLAWLYAEEQVCAFVRQLPEQTLLVMLNGESAEQQRAIPAGEGLPPGTTLQDVWSGETFRVADGRLGPIRLAPLGGRVLQRLSG